MKVREQGKGWKKVRKVFCGSMLFLLLGLGLAYLGFWNLSDLGVTISHKSEVIKKSKSYGMYATEVEVRDGLQSMSKAPNLNAIYNQVSGVLLPERSDSSSLDSHLRDFETRRVVSSSKKVQAELERRLEIVKTVFDPIIESPVKNPKSDWKLTDFFTGESKYDQKGIQSVLKVLIALLYDALLLVSEGKYRRAIEQIQYEALIRRRLASTTTNYQGGVFAILAHKVAADIHAKLLVNAKSPTRELVQTIRECATTPIPFDHRRLSRALFYLGSDWFPKGGSLSDALRPENRACMLVPRLASAWKLKIQYAAILAYEAGEKQRDPIDALQAAMNAFEEETDRGDLLVSVYYLGIPNDVEGLMIEKRVDDAPKVRTQLLEKFH